jgi:hypothetical protein
MIHQFITEIGVHGLFHRPFQPLTALPTFQINGSDSHGDSDLFCSI